jgi:CHAD domain-containing protein
VLTSELACLLVRRHATALIDHAFCTQLERDPEHIHQARVATRRLRAALRVFKEVLPPETQSLSDELHWIAGHFGHARDLDVQIRRLQAHAAQLKINDPVAPFCAWLENRRDDEMTSLEAALKSSRFAKLVTDLETIFLVCHPERSEGSVALVHVEGDGSFGRSSLRMTYKWTAEATALEEFAPAQLKHAWRPLRKRAHKLSPTSAEPEFHAVRIRAKRLRYTAEFFEPIYGKPARRVIQSATDLQDLLGDLQDGVVLTQHIRSAIQTPASTWPAETSLALGELIQWEAQHAERIRDDFKDGYANVERAWGKLGKSL